MPFQQLDGALFDRFKDLPLADRKFFVPSEIEFLLGVDSYCEIAKVGKNSFIKSEPSLLNTHLGYVVLGKAPLPVDDETPKAAFFIREESLNAAVERMWEPEEFPDDLILDHKFCEEYFAKTTKKTSEGRYSVSFPFKSCAEPLGLNRESALRNYLNLEKRLKKTPETWNQYRAFMQEFIDLGHMKPTKNYQGYILPQHCVLRPEKSSTKLRTVFNASVPDNKGLSLNDRMFKGPYIQKDLCTILSHFRFHKIVLVADIKMAYRMIEINEEHLIYQHIFYRPTAESPVLEYEVNRLLYGLRPASFLLQRVLQDLAVTNQQNFPLATHALLNETFMDDLMTGAESVKETKNLRSELTESLQKGGFELKKFISSNPAVLEDLPESQLETSSQKQIYKILGMMYDSSEDVFMFQSSDFTSEVSKRSVLSFIARIFDPLNYLAPVTFQCRYILQQAYALSPKVNWDEKLPSKLRKEWLDFSRDLNRINEVKLPRYIPAKGTTSSLVMFSDASEKGYAAVAYVHSETEESASAYLLRAKTRLAPLKKKTIPRLELSGALEASELASQIVNETANIEFTRVIMFCDSKITLAWIQREPTTLEVYIANRVSKIQTLSKGWTWKYIPSELNAADVASRGASPSQFVENFDEWVKGPKFLEKPISCWPEFDKPVVEEIPGLKKQVLVVQKPIRNKPYEFICQQTSFYRTVRYFAHLNRLSDKLRRKPVTSGPLLAVELKRAMITVAKISQQQFFGDDMKTIKRIQEAAEKGKIAPKNKFNKKTETYTGRLATLNPFVDENGLLVVGGRLQYRANATYFEKHPIIIDPRCHLAKLIIEDTHQKLLHSGPTSVQAAIRTKFWILRAHNLIRSVIRNCVRCIRFDGKVHQPIMAPLPIGRVTESRPFANTAMDFGGPFEMVPSKLRKTTVLKGYFCVFTCLAVRAIHIEVVSELTSEAFLGGLHRFVSRRGPPSMIICDNGRNFCGAARQLDEVSEFLKKNEDKIISFASSLSITFKFHPPYASNFAGIVESQVKAIKNLLYRCLTTRKLTYEEYSTVFARIEAQINQRPLTVVTSNPDDLDILTPGHFLVHGHLGAVPEMPTDDNATYRCRWTALKQICQRFWKRWKSHYLNQLQQRNKWKKNIPNPDIGALVFITGIDTAPGYYPLGRIVKLHPSADGVVRVVTIRIKDRKNVTRAVNKLIFVPSGTHDLDCPCRTV